jgi:hypothetical protein
MARADGAPAFGGRTKPSRFGLERKKKRGGEDKVEQVEAWRDPGKARRREKGKAHASCVGEQVGNEAPCFSFSVST